MKVSVIMPVWNPNEKWLEEAIDSILNQKFDDYEVIIVNDGSDNKDFIDRFKTKDDKIKVFHHEKNLNQASALNTGLKNSSGEYICLLDYDDEYDSDKLSKQVEYLDNNKEIDMVYCDGWIINSLGKVTGPYLLYDNPSLLLKFNCICYCSTMTRKKVFDKVGYFDENLNRSQDYEMWLRIYKQGFKIKKMNKQLIYYRLHPNQKSSKLSIEESHKYIRKKHNL